MTRPSDQEPAGQKPVLKSVQKSAPRSAPRTTPDVVETELEAIDRQIHVLQEEITRLHGTTPHDTRRLLALNRELSAAFQAYLRLSALKREG